MCKGSSLDTISCIGQNCPCELSDWSSWTACSKECGLGGITTRSRRAIHRENCPEEEVLYSSQECFNKICSNEVYKLDTISVHLSEEANSGSDNSWRIRFWNGEKVLCMTDWLDRYNTKSFSLIYRVTKVKPDFLKYLVHFYSLT